MARTHRIVAGPTAFGDNTEHSVVLTDDVAAGETCVALIGCSVTDINGIVGYVDANDGVMTTTGDCATQTTWQKDEEYGDAGGGGFDGVSCFSSYMKNGLITGDTIRFGVKHGSGGSFDASGFYHGQSPYIVVLALSPGAAGEYFVYDTSAGSSISNDSTPHTQEISAAADSIIIGFLAGAVQAGAGWMSPDTGWTEFCDTAAGTESSFNIAGMARIEASAFTGAAGGTVSAGSKSFGAIIASYKVVTTEPTGTPVILVGSRERDTGPGDFFSNGNTAAFPFVAAASGASVRMGGCFRADNPSVTTVRLGIYSHDSGNNRPGTRLGYADVSINPVNLVPFGVTLEGVNIVQGTTYWLAYSGAGEQIDIDGLDSAGFGREGTGNMVATWVAGGNMGVQPGIWVEGAEPIPPQYFRPDEDITTTGWTSTPLWSKIDEDTPDGTVITATAS